MAVADYFNTVQKIYIAFYQRPADPAGLKYWAQRLDAVNGSLTEIINEFATSAETKAVYGEITAENIGTVIDSIYQALFNRAADAQGKQFYIDGFKAGTFTAGSIALNVLNGASSADKVAIDNKLGVANAFTQQVDGRALTDAEFGTGTSFQVTYSGDADAQAARDILKAVTANPATVLSAAQVTEALQSKIANAGDAIGGVTSGKTFMLTAGVDVLEGTAGNDTFIAATVQNNVGNFVQSLTNLDVIDGKGGVNTLKVADDSTAALSLPTSVTVKNIQNVEIVNAALGVTANVENWEGLKNIAVDQRAAAATSVTTKSNATSLTVKGGTTVGVADNGTGTGATKDTLATVSVEKATGLTTINSDALTKLTLTEANGGAAINAAAGSRSLDLTVNKLNNGTVTDGEATGLKVTASGDNTTGITLTAGKATSIEFAGDKTVSTALGAQAANLNITSGNTAGVTITSTLNNDVTFTGGAGKDTVTVGATTKTINMGAGDDTVNVTVALGTAGKLVGGEGTDTLAMTSQRAATLSATDAFSKQVEGFEVLSLGQTATGVTNAVNMSNMKDIALVKSAGTEVGTSETAVVTFQNLLSGQSVTVAGRTVTANGADLTAAQVEAAFLANATTGNVAVSGTLTGWTVAQSGTTTDGALLFTATTPGNVTDITPVSANSTAPTAPTVNTTQGVAAVTESSVVNFVGLIAGETVTVAGRTVNAGTFERAVFTANDLTDGQSSTIAGLTVTSAGGHTATEVITVLTGGTVAGLALTGTLDSGYTLAPTTTTTATFTATTLGNQTTDLSVTGQGSVSVTNGALTNLTAAQVASLAAGGTVAGAQVTGALTGFNAGTANGNSVTFVSSTAGNVTDIAVSTTGGALPSVTTTQGVAAVTEGSTVTFQGLLSGQSVTVAGRTVTANGADLTAAQVEAAFLANATTGNAAVSGTLTGWTVAESGTTTDGALLFTSGTPGSNVADIVVSVASATAPTNAGVATVNGGNGGSLQITNFADNGTLELSGAINGASSVALKNNTSNDTFSLKLNAAANLVNTAALTVAGVENINILTADSNVQFDAMTAASTVLLNAAAAKKIVVSGNHGVDFTGSTFGTDLVELDASGVQATGLTAANLTAAQIATNKGTAGAVTFTAIQTNKDMTVKTGNGNDVITLSALVDATNAATKGATVSTGEGNDTVTGSLGKDTIDLGAGNDRVISSAGTDTITLGAGNDVYRLNSVTDSTINARDVITDFSANKVGVGANGAATTAGAVGTLADRNGDVIEISQALAVKGGVNLSLINVSVFSNAADATTFLANSGAAGNAQSAVNVALDSSTGFLYIDVNDNGTADSVIQLTGVTTIDAAAFAIV